MARFTIAAKRKLLQICAFGFTNARPQNLLTGRLYQGAWKNFCALRRLRPFPLLLVTVRIR